MKSGLYPLASGSKGNCIYLNTGSTKILIDAGLSGKAIKERLATIDVDLSEISAILVSHEHIDHIRGIKVLAYRLGIPVLANSETAKAIIELFGSVPPLKIFATGETFEFGDLLIHPFSIQHDAIDPVAFTIQTPDLKIGICTDLGFPTSLVKAKLQHCNYLYVEANHHPPLVQACNRPMIYKQRVVSRSGHLSNAECAELVQAITHPHLKHVYLAHLSEECNRQELALQHVRAVLGKETSLSIAYQDRVSEPALFEPEEQLV